LGVIFSAASVFIYQGLIVISASWLRPLLIPSVVDQMSAVGGVLIMAIGMNMLEFRRLKAGNMLPAVLIPLIYFMIKKLF
jgi:hypothetical protein